MERKSPAPDWAKNIFFLCRCLYLDCRYYITKTLSCCVLLCSNCKILTIYNNKNTTITQHNNLISLVGSEIRLYTIVYLNLLFFLFSVEEPGLFLISYHFGQLKKIITTNYPSSSQRSTSINYYFSHSRGSVTSDKTTVSICTHNSCFANLITEAQPPFTEKSD